MAGRLIKDYTGGMKLDASVWESGLYKFRQTTQDQAQSLMEEGARELEQYMKNNAPWRDRTGLARSSLSAEISTKNDRHGKTLFTITLESPVVYGEALEKGTSHSRPYPIVEPTIRLKAPQVINRLDGLLNRGSEYAGLIRGL